MQQRSADAHPRRAAAFALCAACLFAGADALVKALVDHTPVVMVAWARMALIVAFLGLSTAGALGARLLRPSAWRLQVLRGLCGVGGSLLVFHGLKVMPLAECMAVASIAPVLSNLLSRWWLDEPGDALSWASALASFAGVLMIARPGAGVFSQAAFYPLGGALVLAVFLTSTRALAGRDDPRVTSFFGPLVSLLVFSLIVPAHWQLPAGTVDLMLLVGVGALSALAQLVDTLAYRHGTTHQVAPFGYASLVASLGLGWWVFDAMPDGSSLAGMAVILVAGLASLAGTPGARQRKQP